MRVTLDIDMDVMEEVASIAARQRKTLGSTISSLLREHLAPDLSGLRLRDGAPLFEKHHQPVCRRTD